MFHLFNEDYLYSVLNKLLTTPSPTGFCISAMKLIEEELTSLGITFELTKRGNGFVSIPGKNPNYTVGLAAHVDTLGAMVTSIKDNGYLTFTPIGGYMLNAVEGEYCQIHTRQGKTFEGTILTNEPSVHVYPAAKDLKRVEENMEIRIDEDVNTKEEVKQLGINAGDFISFDSRTKFINGFIKSRHIDDKAGVAILLTLMEALKRNDLIPAMNVTMMITTYEEVGHGAAYLPSELDELIAIDMGAIGSHLNCTEKQVSICAKDSSGPYDYALTTKLVQIAERDKINYCIDVYPMYGSDVSAAFRGGNDVKGALIGPGVHASHGIERTHIDGIMNTLELLAGYLEIGQ